MENIALKLIYDFGITGGLYVIIVLAFLYYMPKLINKHFESLKHLSENYEKNLDKIVKTFNDQIQISNAWHVKHEKHIIEIKNDIKDVKGFLLGGLKESKKNTDDYIERYGDYDI